MNSFKSLLCSDLFIYWPPCFRGHTYPLPPSFTLTRLIHIEFPFMLTALWPLKNIVSEVGQYSGWGPEATCMHPQDNNSPPPFSSMYRVLSLKAVYCWANGRAGTCERTQGSGWSFSLGLNHKRQLPTNPGAAGKGSAQQGLFLKTRAHGKRRRWGAEMVNGKK